jgi:hypothetical protein
MTSQEIEELAGHRPVPAWVVKLVADAVAEERKACASLCFQMWGKWMDSRVGDESHDNANLPDAEDCAAAIQARGQSKPETVSPAELRRRTNAPWNDKASY